MKIYQAIFIVLSLCWCISANSLSAEQSFSPDEYAGVKLEKQGQALFKVLFYKIYHAELYSPAAAYESGMPVALKLHYLRDISSEEISKRTIKEIRRQGLLDEIRLAAWHQQLKSILPNIEKNDKIWGVRNQEGHVAFYRGNELLGTIADAHFGNHFFDIWLSEKASLPSIRKKLLNRSVD